MVVKNRIIRIFDTKYKIKFVDSIEDKKEEGLYTLGRTNSVNKTILIALKDPDGNNLNINEMETTLIHEIIHAILDEGQYSTSSSDEPLVEWLAKCIKSLIKQKIFV